MKLPSRVFYTGVPGSSWSAVAQLIEQNPEFNTTDRTPTREYFHSLGARHIGAYFGSSMEFPAEFALESFYCPMGQTFGHEIDHCDFAKDLLVTVLR